MTHSPSAVPLEMADLENMGGLFLVYEEKLLSIFQRRGTTPPGWGIGNNGIFLEGSQQFKVMSTDSLLQNVKGKDDFADNLKNALKKTLGDRQSISSDSITFSWKINFISAWNACVELYLSGNFLEKFLREYKLPIAVKIWFEFQLRLGRLEIESEELNPSLSIGKGSTDGFRTCVFEYNSNEEIKKLIPTNEPIKTYVTIELVAIRSARGLVTENLPCKMTMGQSILENKIESDFAIIAEDGTRLECNKVFLASNSKAWAGMLQMNCKETKEKAIKLKMSAKGVNALLKFIYYANIDDPLENPSIALELLEIGHQYNILGLEEAMCILLLAQKNEWFDIDTALLLYLHTLTVEGNEDLKWKALHTFKSKPDDLEGSIVYERLLKEDSKTAMQLVALCFKI